MAARNASAPINFNLDTNLTNTRPLGGAQSHFQSHSTATIATTASSMLRSSVHPQYPSHPTFKSIGDAPIITSPITRQLKEKMSHHPYQRRTVGPVIPALRQHTITGRPENYALERDIVMRKMYDVSHTGWKQLQKLINSSVKANDLALTKEMLKNLAPYVIDNDPHDRTMWLALQWGEVQQATRMICAGTDLNRRHPVSGASYLHWLASKVDKKYYELATMIMDYGADVNASDKNDNSVLHAAAEFGLPEMVVELVKRNANIETVNKAGHKVVYAAAKSSRVADMLPLLIGYSRDVVTRNKRCIEAFYALTDVNAGHRQIRMLLDMGFPLDQYGRKGSKGSTLLYDAVLEKKIDAVKLLLEYGADINKKLRNGKLPLHAASQHKDPAILKLLIQNGASIHDCSDDYNGQYPIHGACKHESLSNIKLLLLLGADVNVIDKNGRTPFSLVSTEKFTDLQACVIKHIAISVARTDAVSRSDLVKIRGKLKMQDYYEKCLMELQTMKETMVHDNVSFFCLLDRYVINLAKSLAKVDLMEHLDKFQERLRDSFPVYHEEIQHLFRLVERAKFIMNQKRQLVEEIPHAVATVDHIVDLIVFYSCLDEIRQMKRDYYFSSVNFLVCDQSTEKLASST